MAKLNYSVKKAGSRCHDPVADLVPEEALAEFMADIAEVIDEVADTMPDHAAFIAQHCAAPSISA
jgi:tryptophan halogenase